MNLVFTIWIILKVIPSKMSNIFCNFFAQQLVFLVMKHL